MNPKPPMPERKSPAGDLEPQPLRSEQDQRPPETDERYRFALKQVDEARRQLIPLVVDRSITDKLDPGQQKDLRHELDYLVEHIQAIRNRLLGDLPATN